MFDEIERLRDAKELYGLLGYYGERGVGDRQAWQDRPGELEGVGPRDLVKLHGELLAYGWVEQNTGATPVLQKGVARQCYRITPAGLRALKQVRPEAARPG